VSGVVANLVSKVSTPSLTLPRKRERGLAIFAVSTLPHRHPVPTTCRVSIGSSRQRSALPLPLAGEGWGGGQKVSDKQKPSWHVTATQRSRARTLRKNLTDAERTMWTMLRGRHLDGFAFRRQFPIGPFIADFVCLATKLVIEIDGGQHFSDDGEMRDARRTAFIESEGFRVMRFSNHDVLTNRAGVLQAIAAAIRENAPSLPLPHKGGGNGKILSSESDLRSEKTFPSESAVISVRGPQS